MPTIDLPQGTLHYRVSGPDGAAADADALPPVVFLHGFLADATLWSAVTELLAARGITSYALDLPLGAHRIALDADADVSPRGVARLVTDALAALDLHGVVLVGNDTGGALCQFVVDTDAKRIGSLVLTNCDAFDAFPPWPFRPTFALLRSERRMRFLLGTMRPRILRNSPLGFGLLAHHLDPEQTAAWGRPAREDAGVRRDAVKFLRGVDRRELLDVSTRLARFAGRVRIVWGADDHAFTSRLGRRLAEQFGTATYVSVPKSKTFVPIDRPDTLADEIARVATPGH